MNRVQMVREAVEQVYTAREHLEICATLPPAGNEAARIDDMLTRLQRATERIRAAQDLLIQAGGKP